MDESFDPSDPSKDHLDAAQNPYIDDTEESDVIIPEFTMADMDKEVNRG